MLMDATDSITGQPIVKSPALVPPIMPNNTKSGDIPACPSGGTETSSSNTSSTGNLGKDSKDLSADNRNVDECPSRHDPSQSMREKTTMNRPQPLTEGALNLLEQNTSLTAQLGAELARRSQIEEAQKVTSGEMEKLRSTIVTDSGVRPVRNTLVYTIEELKALNLGGDDSTGAGRAAQSILNLATCSDSDGGSIFDLCSEEESLFGSEHKAGANNRDSSPGLSKPRFKRLAAKREYLILTHDLENSLLREQIRQADKQSRTGKTGEASSAKGTRHNSGSFPETSNDDDLSLSDGAKSTCSDTGHEAHLRADEKRDDARWEAKKEKPNLTREHHLKRVGDGVSDHSEIELSEDDPDNCDALDRFRISQGSTSRLAPKKYMGLKDQLRRRRDTLGSLEVEGEQESCYEAERVHDHLRNAQRAARTHDDVRHRMVAALDRVHRQRDEAEAEVGRLREQLEEVVKEHEQDLPIYRSSSNLAEARSEKVKQQYTTALQQMSLEATTMAMADAQRKEELDRLRARNSELSRLAQAMADQRIPDDVKRLRRAERLSEMAEELRDVQVKNIDTLDALQKSSAENIRLLAQTKQYDEGVRTLNAEIAHLNAQLYSALRASDAEQKSRIQAEQENRRIEHELANSRADNQRVQTQMRKLQYATVTKAPEAMKEAMDSIQQQNERLAIDRSRLQQLSWEATTELNWLKPIYNSLTKERDGLRVEHGRLWQAFECSETNRGEVTQELRSLRELMGKLYRI